jgi:hypothetical protein
VKGIIKCGSDLPGFVDPKKVVPLQYHLVSDTSLLGAGSNNCSSAGGGAVVATSCHIGGNTCVVDRNPVVDADADASWVLNTIW